MDSVKSGSTGNNNLLLEDLVPLKVINESTLSMITYFSLNYHFLKAPHTLCKLLGYSESELLQLKLDDIIYPDDYKNFISVTPKLLNHEIKSFDIECRCYSKVSEYVWIHMSCSLVHDEASNSICYIAYITNISDRKFREDKLIEANKNLEKIISEQNARLNDKQYELVDFVENAPLGLHWVGPDGIIQWANKSEMDLLGYPPEEYIGQHISKFHADKKTIDDILTRLSNNETLSSYEARLIAKDGSIKTVLISSNVYRVNGRFIHTRCFTKDITDRKQAELKLREGEEALRRSENERRIEFQRMLNKLPAGAYTCDEEGLITFYNEKAVELWGRAPKLNDAADRFCGSFKLFIHGEPIKHDECWMALALKNNQGYNGQEVEIERPNGEKLTVMANANPVHDEDGKLIGAINVLVDISDRKALEEALRESEQKFHAIFKQASVGIAKFDLTGKFVLVNQRYCDIVGRTQKDLLNLHLQDITHPDDLPNNIRLFNNLIEKGEEFILEKRYIKPDGSIAWIRKSVALIRDVHDKPQFVAAICADITAQKTAELEREIAQKTYQSLFESTLDGILIVNNEGKYVNVNESYAKMLKSTREELIGQDFSKFMPPDRLQDAINQFGRLKGNTMHSRSEFPLLATDGSIVEAEWISRSNFLPGLHFCVARDITERKLAEKKLKEEYSFRKGVENSIAAGIAAVNAEGVQTYVNPALCNMLGWTEEELLGRGSPHLYWPEEEMDNIVKAFEATLSGTAPKEGFELKFMRKNGERFDVLVSVTPLNDSNPEGSKWLASVTDISEMKRVQKEIKEAYDKMEERVIERTAELKSLIEDMSIEITERKRAEEKLKVTYEKLRETQTELINSEKLASLGRFSAGVAHEIRNPLANISALAQIVSEKSDDPKSKKLLNYILENSEIANTIIKDLLNFASPYDVKFEKADLGKILNNLYELSLTRCTQSKVNLVKEIDSDLPLVVLNEEKLSSAFLNFISNAIQAMPEGGDLKITAAADASGKEVIVSFKDTGVGISKEHLDKILEPFFTTKDEGTGLGLSLAYHVIRAHSGKLNIESELNSGTEIIVTLPVNSELI